MDHCKPFHSPRHNPPFLRHFQQPCHARALCSYPTTEEEQQALFAQGVFPEKVVALRVSPEQYVRRRVDGEYRRRCAERARRVRELKRQRLLLARRQKRHAGLCVGLPGVAGWSMPPSLATALALRIETATHP